MSDAIEAALRGAGLTDKPGEFGSSIHSWRCEHPETYGPCDCFQELVRELASVERAAAEKAWREGELAGTRNQRDFHLYQQGKITETEYERRVNERANPHRAEAYRQERGDHGSDS